MQVHRSEIVAALQARGLEDRALWVTRELPETVDTERNSALLRMLKIDVSGMTPVQAPPQP